MSLVRRELLALATLAAFSACGRSSPPSSPAAQPSPTVQATPGAALTAPKVKLSAPGNYDVRAPKDRLAKKATLPAALAGRHVQVDPALGVPAFLWPERRGQAARRAAGDDPVAAARAHLGANADAYGLAASDVDAAPVAAVHDTGRGAIIVKFRQELDGVEVFRDEASVAMDRQLGLVAISGSLAPVASGKVALAARRFTLDARGAVASALSDLTGRTFAAGDLLAAGAKGRYTQTSVAGVTASANADLAFGPARAKQVWFRQAKLLVPAWYVEVGANELRYGYVVSANDGAVLFRKNQVQDAFKYRVWADPTTHVPYDGPQGYAGTPHPTGLPDGYQAPLGPQALVELDETSAAVNDPWLPADATTTEGNNVSAYANITAPDFFNAGDVMGTVSAPGTFDYPYDFTEQPFDNVGQRQAAITQLFYDINFFHDWYYDSGFTEAWSNAQEDNYGRGGLAGDAIQAEAQDYSGTDNANMWTPSDGQPPRMRMYVFTPNTPFYLEVNAPADLAGKYAVGPALFGLQAFDATNDVVYGAPANGCTALTNAAAVAGKFVILDRGTCAFTVKATTAVAAGATGVIIKNNANALLNMSGTADLAVPVVNVTLTDGNAIEAALTAGTTVNVRLRRDAGIYRDGTIDNAIVAHEWGHYISNRLVGDGAGLDTNQAGGLGEGWGDTHAMLLVVRAEDAQVPSNAQFNGVYGLAGFVSGGFDSFGAPNQGYYFGIRRVPYSTDMSKDPLTFRHIAEGQPIPTQTSGGVAIPVAFGENGVGNSEVHNTGEVWATMLWECYASLLRDTQGTTPRLTFAQAQARWKDYLVAAYKLTPVNPTLLQARDAVLAAALASDPADYKLFWAAFAKRGAGVGAVGPDAYSTDNTGVVESYDAGPELELLGASFGAVTSTCDDKDGVLDSGEAGTLTLHLANTSGTALAAATATISASEPGLTFPGGTTVQVPATTPGQRVDVPVKVALDGVTAPTDVTLTLTFADGYLLLGPDVSGQLKVHYDVVRDASAVENFDTALNVWTPVEVQPRIPGFTLDGEGAFAPDNGTVSDTSLVSPPLVVSANQNLVVSFSHVYGFEVAGIDANNRYVGYDGAVVELSTFDGQAWSDWEDIGASAYNGWIIDGGRNPLELRDAFVYQNASFPNFDTVTLDLGAAYAGKTVKIRFRVGSDIGTGAPGWYIDWVAVDGVVNTPFPVQSADARRCVNRQPVADAGPAQAVDEGTAAHLDGSASSDPDGAALTYAWTQVSGVTVTLAGAGTATPTFTAPQVSGDSTLAFLLTVSDGTFTSTATTTVTVRNVNHPPVAAVGADQTVNERTVAVLDASGSTDPDADTVLTYAWTQTAGPSVTLVGANTARPSFTAPAVDGDTGLTFRVTVSDGTATSQASTTVTVKNTDKKGGGCSTAPGTTNPAVLLLLAAAALFLPRRRAARAQR